MEESSLVEVLVVDFGISDIQPALQIDDAFTGSESSSMKKESDCRRSFEVWSRFCSGDTKALIRLVQSKIVSPLASEEFKWITTESEFGNIIQNISGRDICLIRRSGVDWMLINIRFDKNRLPLFSISVTAFPEVCYKLDGKFLVEISRHDAELFDGDFDIIINPRPGKWLDGGQFGAAGHWSFSLFHPIKTIRYLLNRERLQQREVEVAASGIESLLDCCKDGVPAEWKTMSCQRFINDFLYLSLNVGARRRIAAKLDR
jgi:hypothetical protein